MTGAADTNVCRRGKIGGRLRLHADAGLLCGVYFNLRLLCILIGHASVCALAAAFDFSLAQGRIRFVRRALKDAASRR